MCSGLTSKMHSNSPEKQKISYRSKNYSFFTVNELLLQFAEGSITRALL